MDLTASIYHDPEAARKHIEYLRWPEGAWCPHCGCLDRINPVAMNNKPSILNPDPKPVPGYYHCGDCRKKFTVRTGTLYARSHVPLNKWLLATHLLCASKKGISSGQLGRLLGVTEYTAWFLAHRIRIAMISRSPDILGGPGKSVQADETYFGIKDDFRGLPWHLQKGHSNKMSVFSMICEGRARTFHLARADIQTIARVMAIHIDLASDLWTDESWLYRRVGKKFKRHKTVRHSRNEYVRDGAHINNAENYFSIFKRGMTGIYHHCSEKYLQLYLAEFDFRYNTRDVDDFERSRLACLGALVAK